MSCYDRRNVSVDSGRGSFDQDMKNATDEVERVDVLRSSVLPPNTDIKSVVDTDAVPHIETGSLDLHWPEEEVDFENVESRAVGRAYLLLRTAMTSLVDELAADFYTHELIESEHKNRAQTQGIPDQNRATILLDAVMDKIRISPTPSFNKFIQVLGKHDSCHEIARKIDAKHAELCELESRGQHLAPVHISVDTTNNEDGVHSWLCSSCRASLFRDRKLLIQRQYSISGTDSCESMMTEEIPHVEMKGLKASAPTAGLVLLKRTDHKKRSSGIKGKVLHLTQSEMEKTLEEYGDLELKLQIAQKQIHQLNEEIINLRRKQYNEKLKKAIEDETLECIATLKNLTQQRELLLNLGD